MKGLQKEILIFNQKIK